MANQNVIEFILRAADHASGALRETASSLGEVGESAEEASSATRKSSSVLSELSDAISVVKGVIGAFAANELLQLLMGLANLGIESMRAERAMTALLGSGEDVTGVMAGLREATDNAVSDMELSALATEALASGLAETGEEAVNLIGIADALGDVMGRDTAESFRMLTIALQTGSVRALRGLGLDAAAVRARIDELTNSSSNLTREQIIFQAVMEQARGIIEQTTDANLDQLEAIDRLRARWENLRVEIGERVAPVMLTAADAAYQMITWNEQLVAVLRDHDTELRNLGLSYEDYRAEMIRAAEAAGYVVDEEGRLTRGIFGFAAQVIDANYLMSEAMYRATTVMDGMSEAARAAARADRELVSASNEVTLGQREIDAAMRDLATTISGRVGRESERYQEQLNGMRGKLADLAGQINALEGLSYLTPAQQEQLSSLRGEYEQTSAGLAQLQADHQRAMAQIVYDMTLARLATDGFTQDEMELATTVAESMGLVDRETATAINNINAAIARFDEDGNLEQAVRRIGNVASALDGIPREIDVNVNVNTRGGMPGVPGGGIIGMQHGTDRVPETGVYLLHAGEAVLNPRDAALFRLALTEMREATRGRSGNGGGAVINNYSFSITPDQRQGTSVFDYAMMRAMAG